MCEAGRLFGECHVLLTLGANSHCNERNSDHGTVWQAFLHNPGVPDSSQLLARTHLLHIAQRVQQSEMGNHELQFWHQCLLECGGRT
jgi:hypothetical protein